MTTEIQLLTDAVANLSGDALTAFLWYLIIRVLVAKVMFYTFASAIVWCAWNLINKAMDDASQTAELLRMIGVDSMRKADKEIQNMKSIVRKYWEGSRGPSQT